MTNNTASQRDCLFLQIWLKIRKCSFLRALYVCPDQMTSKGFDLLYQNTSYSFYMLFCFLGFFFLWIYNLCMVQWQQVSPRGWQDEQHRSSTGWNINNMRTWGESSIWARLVQC